ncbi:MAG: bifunctional (p)ppGpp synthetase/guanosine-3',5'-bis(diphosphate) 3'-pyrophosphohydrolase [Gammaproteobacteria bacterium]|nr:bifunctional (p)ppGpp synthetase/guanosine-3',5'-bis(diphosphate) 3'-pyrophosphohydrolase [Gammaproteobacteria bacterium]
MDSPVAQSIDYYRERLSSHLPWDEQLEQALQLAWHAKKPEKCRPRALDAVIKLVEFQVDKNTILATLVSDMGLKDSLPDEEIKSGFGEEVLNLARGIVTLNSMQDCNEHSFRTPQQAEKLRRLLMAIIKDVRVMLIKLCYRSSRLQLLKHCSYEERRCVAKETLDIYAPLANRLGIGKLKWEMEDLSFRALEPLTFKRIANLLEERREEREQFIEAFTQELGDLIHQSEIEGKVSGRVKHIVSIWRKMQRKKLEFHQLFDVRAVRVLVNSVADCYAVLGIVHTNWHSIPDEFDDYIANPKDNGYQSLHTAVMAEGGKVVEVQIRTFEMHEKSEFGVASHWRYKEGVSLDQRMEKSIAVMRDLLSGSEESATDALSGFSTELSTDRVYVFTPQGQVVDLPAGATPLDFAYSIHSAVGHRCRGAKVNGRIVNLTYKLSTGERVEILTAKEGAPSRDWMNKNLGFLKSASNRAKVRNWYNQLDFEQNVLDGKNLYERELVKFNYHDVNLAELIGHFKRKDDDQFFADIGRGLITGAQIIGHLQYLLDEKAEDPFKKVKKSGKSQKRNKDDIVIQGVGNLLTQFAKCCKPLPGDSVIGFITKGSGVTIHKQDCKNILSLPEEQKTRLVEVEWGSGSGSLFQAEITITAYDRNGLLRDISSVLANEKINLLGINSNSNVDEQMVYSKLNVEVDSVDQLVLVIDRLAQVPNVLTVNRTH